MNRNFHPLMFRRGRGVFVIAELGVNHDGREDLALELTDAAADAGADAVKLQFFRADLLMSRAARLADYQRSSGEIDPRDMLARLELGQASMERIIDRAHARGLAAICTVFSLELVPDADRLGFDAFKSASPDIIHKPLLSALAATGRPLIVSTGASTEDEIRRALAWLAPAEGRLALLQCVSAYPTAPQDAELGGIAALAGLFPGPVGYSDHTPCVDTGAAACLAGATILEKHLTHDRAAQGPDHAASLDPIGLTAYVMLARRAAQRRGSGPAGAPPRAGVKRLLPCEADVRAVSRQSLVTRRPLRAGHVLDRADITFKRPGTGLPPWRLEAAIGRPLARNLPVDALLMPDDLHPPLPEVGHHGQSVHAPAAADPVASPPPIVHVSS